MYLHDGFKGAGSSKVVREANQVQPFHTNVVADQQNTLVLRDQIASDYNLDASNVLQPKHKAGADAVVVRSSDFLAKGTKADVI